MDISDTIFIEDKGKKAVGKVRKLMSHERILKLDPDRHNKRNQQKKEVVVRKEDLAKVGKIVKPKPTEAPTYTTDLWGSASASEPKKKVQKIRDDAYVDLPGHEESVNPHRELHKFVIDNVVGKKEELRVEKAKKYRETADRLKRPTLDIMSEQALPEVVGKMTDKGLLAQFIVPEGDGDAEPEIEEEYFAPNVPKPKVDKRSLRKKENRKLMKQKLKGKESLKRHNRIVEQTKRAQKIQKQKEANPEDKKRGFKDRVGGKLVPHEDLGSIALPDELGESLRDTEVQMSLMKDTYHKMAQKGYIEPRRRKNLKRRYPKKVRKVPKYQ
ncbi:hypothetical protein PCE1_001987 [Barthelona sp. PCE]